MTKIPVRYQITYENQSISTRWNERRQTWQLVTDRGETFYNAEFHMREWATEALAMNWFNKAHGVKEEDDQWEEVNSP